MSIDKWPSRSSIVKISSIIES
jgi:hypothetical protein